VLPVDAKRPAVSKATLKLAVVEPRPRATQFAVRLLRFLPALPFTILSHRLLHGDWRTFRDPHTYTERLQAKKLYDHDPRYPITADKYAVRAWVAERIGAEYLVPLVADVTDDFMKVDWDSLPNSFVVKATNSSNANVLINDKSQHTQREIAEQTALWRRKSHYRLFKEWAYRSIPPRIIVEEHLCPGGAPPPDVKFFVLNGRAELVGFDSDRFGDHRRETYDREGRLLDLTLDIYPRSDVPPALPKNWTDLRDIAEKLGAEFEFVRVDLYSRDGAVFFGEITHYPGGAASLFGPRDFDAVFGDIWGHGGEIPSRYYAQPALS
jgi:TupA-like ATPgrasp